MIYVDDGLMIASDAAKVQRTADHIEDAIHLVQGLLHIEER